MHIDSFFYLDKIRAIALNLPGVSEGVCYGTPGFYAGKKLFARIKEEGDVLVVYTEDREKWMKKNPGVFFITPHYQNYPYMLIALDKVENAHLSQLIKQAWRNRATKTLLKQFDKNEAPAG